MRSPAGHGEEERGILEEEGGEIPNIIGAVVGFTE